MTTVREPIVHPVAISDLRPTQFTVGLREVAAKREAWRQRRGPQQGGEFLGRHMIPVIRGPKDRLYLIDHHHLARALHDEGQEQVLVTVVKDLHALTRESFWFVLDNHNWLHAYDARGRRRPYTELPKTVAGLVDDPYRSLAGELRHVGGFAKDTTPFSEFLWADFLRRRVRRRAIGKDFDAALKQSLRLARSEDASYLPGWCGAVARVEKR